MVSKGNNHYPFANASRVLWKLGKYIIIFLFIWYLFFNVILNWISLGFMKLSNSNILQNIINMLNQVIGTFSTSTIPPSDKVGKRMNEWVLDKGSISSVSTIVWLLVIVVILYLATILLRHHYREQAPFLNDLEAKWLKAKMPYALGSRKKTKKIDDKKVIREDEKQARKHVRKMKVHINTRKNENEAVPTKEYFVLIKTPSNDDIDNILAKKIKNMPKRLRQQTGGVIFGEMERTEDEKGYYYRGSKEAKIKEARSVKKNKTNKSKKQSINTDVSNKGNTNELGYEPTFPLDLFVDRSEEIKNAIKDAHDFAENMERKISSFLTSTEKSATHKLTQVGKSSVLYQYRIAFSKNQTSEKAAQYIEDGLSDALSVEGILVSGGASLITITLPLKEGEEDDGTLKYNYNIPIDVKEMIKQVDFTEPTDMILGITPDNHVQHFPLAIAPHLLICGSTGSGKSVNVQQMLISMMIHEQPDILKFMIIDPKRGDFAFYKNLPYMLADPITDMDDAMDAITYLTIIMEERSRMFENTGVRDIKGYNKWAKENGNDILPYIVVTIDEYAQLMKKHKEVEEPIQELAQMARASGIHLIIGTQTPRANIITGAIRDNIDTRVAMKVVNSMASGIALDDTGAEKLKKRGDMLIKRDDRIVRAQGAFITDDEIKNIFSYLRDNFDKPIYVDYKKIVARVKGEEDEDSDEGVPPKSVTISTNADRKRPTTASEDNESNQSVKGSTNVSTSKSSLEILRERANKKRQLKETKTNEDSNKQVSPEMNV